MGSRLSRDDEEWKNTPCVIGGGNVRWWYQRKFGKLPDDIFVLHRCDNPPCRNVNHIFLGSQKDNMQDCSNKGRNKGIIKSPETRLAMSLAKRGIARTEEEKRKISEKLKGRPSPTLGVTMTESQKDKLRRSAANRNFDKILGGWSPTHWSVKKTREWITAYLERWNKENEAF